MLAARLQVPPTGLTSFRLCPPRCGKCAANRMPPDQSGGMEAPGTRFNKLDRVKRLGCTPQLPRLAPLGGPEASKIPQAAQDNVENQQTDAHCPAPGPEYPSEKQGRGNRQKEEGRPIPQNRAQLYEPLKQRTSPVSNAICLTFTCRPKGCHGISTHGRYAIRMDLGGWPGAMGTGPQPRKPAYRRSRARISPLPADGEVLT